MPSFEDWIKQVLSDENEAARQSVEAHYESMTMMKGVEQFSAYLLNKIGEYIREEENASEQAGGVCKGEEEQEERCCPEGCSKAEKGCYGNVDACIP